MEKENVVCIDLGGSKIHAGRVSGGKVELDNVVPLDLTQDPFLQILRSIDQVRNSATVSIGIGVPGLVDAATGTIHDLYNVPKMQDFPLTAKLEDATGLKVFIENDANCFILGERYFGAGLEAQHLAGVTLGTGMGVGIITNGQLLRGNYGAAGEIGCMPYLEHTVEYYASGSYFKNVHGVSGSKLYNQAMVGNPGALDKFDLLGIHIGHALKLILFAFAPEVVILGGSVAHSFDFFQSSMQKELSSFPFKQVVDELRVLPSQNPHAALLGASKICNGATLINTIQ